MEMFSSQKFNVYHKVILLEFELSLSAVNLTE